MNWGIDEDQFVLISTAMAEKTFLNFVRFPPLVIIFGGLIILSGLIMDAFRLSEMIPFSAFYIPIGIAYIIAGLIYRMLRKQSKHLLIQFFLDIFLLSMGIMFINLSITAPFDLLGIDIGINQVAESMAHEFAWLTRTWYLFMLSLLMVFLVVHLVYRNKNNTQA